MNQTEYDYGIGTATSPPILLEPTLARAEARLERLQPRYGEESLVIWRRPRPAWEPIPEQGARGVEVKE